MKEEPDKTTQPVVEPNLTTPVQEPTPNKAPANKKVIVSIIVAVLLLGGITTAIGLRDMAHLFSTHSNSCYANKDKFLSSENVKIMLDRFDRLVLIPDQPALKSEFTGQGGDCFDSLPSISAEKTYVVSSSAGVIFDQVKSALKSAGYIAAESQNTLKPCASSFEEKEFYFSDNNSPEGKITIKLNCAAFATEEQDWRQMPVTDVKAHFSLNWKDTSEY